MVCPNESFTCLQVHRERFNSSDVVVSNKSYFKVPRIPNVKAFKNGLRP